MKSTQSVPARTVARHRLLVVSAVLLLLPLFAVSQGYHLPARTAAPTAPPTTAISSAAAQARRDQLAKIPELLADPDPNARMANMETILATNDATMIQAALRLAFRSDDASLRSLAFRAYIANLKGVTFDILISDKVKSLYEAAQDDPRRQNEFYSIYSYIRKLEQLGFRDHLVFQRYNSTESTGTLVDARRENDPAEFAISGDRLSARVREAWGGYCNIEFRPSNDMTLQGTMSCEEYNGPFPKFTITAPLF
jgi:hypothetical protein